MTDRQGFVRRASYGPSSPNVGSRGARTRQQILEAALQCFTDEGFHATAIDDIATGADVSRATLYQYFEHKEAIFIELMVASGHRLRTITRELGPLGPTLDGFVNLGTWVERWASNFDHYAPMFIEWANVNASNVPLRAQVTGYLDVYIAKMADRFTSEGYEGADPAAAALLVHALLSRFNYIRQMYGDPGSDERMTTSLACAVQRYLFPDTPDAVLVAAPARWRARLGEALPSERPRSGPRLLLPLRSDALPADQFAGRSPQARRTTRALLDAAAVVFASYGYNAANIDLIVNEAGLARGTFYRYFADKREILTMLSFETAAVMCPLVREFQSFGTGREGQQLRSWLHRFLDVHRHYTGVMKAWTEGFSIEPALLEPAAQVTSEITRAIMATYGPARPYVLDRRAAAMMFAGLLENFPNEGTGSKFEPHDDAIVEAQAQFIERVILDPSRSH